ncbi:MAG: hypothetical protein ACYS22_07465 [Planctomycetota bacterium]|jgi:hypothetical protein
MPAEAVHLTSLREALALPNADPGLRTLVTTNNDEARLGAVLIDFPYFQRFPEQVARYVLGFTQRHAPWGARLHEQGPIPALEAMLAQARATRDSGLAALVVGLISHATIDRMLHPLVNALARENGMRRGLSRMSAHMEVEKYQSICFHEIYNGHDFMGTPTLARYINLSLAPALNRHPLGDAYRQAIGQAFSLPLGSRELGAWGRGYRAFTRLISSPFGRTLAPERKKAKARPLYMEGAWGAFPDLLSEAIERSVPVLNAAFHAFSATDADAEQAFASLRAWLPEGTIDGLGQEVELEAPYSPLSFLPTPE